MQIKMPKDLDNIKSNLIGPFSLRQLIGLGISAAAVWVCWKALRAYLSLDICLFICMLIAAPALAVGFIPPSVLQGLYPEQYAWQMLYYNFLRPNRRKYKTKNAWDSTCTAYSKRVREKQQLEIKSRTRKQKKEAKAFNASLKGVR